MNLTRITFLLLVAFMVLACKQSEKQTNQNRAQTELETNQDSVVEQQLGGLALYTVRDEMKSNPKQVLATVADAGYAYVEDAGYADRKFYGMEPSQFKALLDSLDLDPVSSHQGGITFDNADATIADVKAAGFEYLVIPVPPMGSFTVDEATRTMGMKGGAAQLAETLNVIGKKCNEAGIKLLYHNHDFEFKKDADGIVPIDYLLENTDPAIVNFEIDLYWATKAGADPIEYFKSYPGRFMAWHVKDMDEQGRFAPVGKGTIDFKSILSHKDTAGMQYYFVEQDRTYEGMTPMKAIEISHDALPTIGFE